MITHLRGKLIEKNQSDLIIDCNGIGYFLHISSYTYSSLSEIGQDIYIYTYPLIKDNQHVLYGFYHKKERKTFSDLISVNGIGPGSAITLLSYLTPEEVEKAIYQENINIFHQIKGIGIKTAKRIIIELKDKIKKNLPKEQKVCFSDKNCFNIKNKKKKEEALKALIVLGFYTQESKKILDEILDKNPEYTVEHLIKESIKKL
ncbi:Holliday junction branch migration protein RuvA [Blattabacterium cuenoti]|uniref:Holliday junction branch migration protein RuvA n=1 Tax=Blattabacterium cuenoti TaxID=1653831 RepID=UPI00163BA4E2|nr:Holliday junction branch migration protein RuvA [Blattabacterium cuenoti]